jgi:hypothetical protein
VTQIYILFAEIKKHARHYCLKEHFFFDITQKWGRTFFLIKGRGGRTFFLIKGWGSYFFLDKKVPKNNCVEAPTLGNIQASVTVALT